jgi:hypothetical protein
MVSVCVLWEVAGLHHLPFDRFWQLYRSGHRQWKLLEKISKKYMTWELPAKE